jgi:hypothetical protein
MKTKLYVNLIAIMALLLTGCTVEEHRHVYAPPPPPPPPPPVVVAPAPLPPPVVVVPPPPRHGPKVVAPPVYVPQYYVWDGYEYVGWSGQMYIYLAPHGDWVPCDKVVIARFHKYEKKHPNWRKEATPYHGQNPHHGKH